LADQWKIFIAVENVHTKVVNKNNKKCDAPFYWDLILKTFNRRQ
jgi:hypothetical protein